MICLVIYLFFDNNKNYNWNVLENKYSQIIKQDRHRLGFDYCGIAKAQQLDEDARRLESWLNKGFQGSMDYMNNYFDLRIDPPN